MTMDVTADRSDRDAVRSLKERRAAFQAAGDPVSVDPDSQGAAAIVADSGSLVCGSTTAALAVQLAGSLTVGATPPSDTAGAFPNIAVSLTFLRRFRDDPRFKQMLADLPLVVETPETGMLELSVPPRGAGPKSVWGHCEIRTVGPVRDADRAGPVWWCWRRFLTRRPSAARHACKQP